MLVGYLGTKETKGDSCRNKEKCCRVVYNCGSVIVWLTDVKESMELTASHSSHKLKCC